MSEQTLCENIDPQNEIIHTSTNGGSYAKQK